MAGIPDKMRQNWVRIESKTPPRLRQTGFSFCLHKILGRDLPTRIEQTNRFPDALSFTCDFLSIGNNEIWSEVLGMLMK
jgi:hypothetical protein